MSRKKNDNGVRRGGWTNTVRADRLYVSVYCRGGDENPHDKWRVVSFRRDEQSWTENVSGYADHDDRCLFRVLPEVTQYLVDDRWIRSAAALGFEPEAGLRSRWALRCAVCKFGDVFASTNRYTAALDQLSSLQSDDKIIEVPLRAFVAHLKGRRRN